MTNGAKDALVVGHIHTASFPESNPGRIFLCATNQMQLQHYIQSRQQVWSNNVWRCCTESVITTMHRNQYQCHQFVINLTGQVGAGDTEETTLHMSSSHERIENSCCQIRIQRVSPHVIFSLLFLSFVECYDVYSVLMNVWLGVQEGTPFPGSYACAECSRQYTDLVHWIWNTLYAIWQVTGS